MLKDQCATITGRQLLVMDTTATLYMITVQSCACTIFVGAEYDPV